MKPEFGDKHGEVLLTAIGFACVACVYGWPILFHFLGWI